MMINCWLGQKIWITPIILLLIFIWIKWNVISHSQLPIFHKCNWKSYNDIGCKIDIAKQQFDKKIVRQSKSIKEARENYRKRYKRQPPRLFDTWVTFALEHNSAIIDDFDQIEKDLTPFRSEKLSKLEWRKRIGEVKKNAAGEMLGTLSIIDGHAVSMGPVRGTMSSATLETLIQPIAPFLSDITVLYNWYAEPRILAKPKASSTASKLNIPPSTFANLTGKVTKDSLLQSCPYNSLVMQGTLDEISARDYCSQSKVFHQKNLHGFLEAPDNFLPTNTQIPLLSRAKMSVFNDILAPNVCYGHTDYRIWNENDTVPFQDKLPALYWRGTTTGITVSKDNWTYGHRHQFVYYIKMLTDYIGKTGSHGKDSERVFPLSLPVKGAGYNALQYLSPDNFEIGFSSITPETPADIRQLISHYTPLKESHPHARSYDYQFVMDLDGQSMSCRFYSLLASNSIVFKQTLWGEWHDDRLSPWVHYIPIDVDLSKHQIPEYLYYLTKTEVGKRKAEAIATGSRLWSDKSLRSIDLTIYFFRLLMEMESIFGSPDVL